MQTLLNYELALHKMDDELSRAETLPVKRTRSQGSRGIRFAGIRSGLGMALIAAGRRVQGTARETCPQPATAATRG